MGFFDFLLSRCEITLSKFHLKQLFKCLLLLVYYLSINVLINIDLSFREEFLRHEPIICYSPLKFFFALLVVWALRLNRLQVVIVWQLLVVHLGDPANSIFFLTAKVCDGLRYRILLNDYLFVTTL